MSKQLAMQDTKLIRDTLNFGGGRVYSENRSYGRRIKFYCTQGPASTADVCVDQLKEAFGDRFISCGKVSGWHGPDFIVKLKDFDNV